MANCEAISKKPSSQQTRFIDWFNFLIAAFIHWSGSSLIIAPLMVAYWKNCLAFIRRKTLLWLLLSNLGMDIGGIVIYWGLTRTIATNGT